MKGLDEQKGLKGGLVVEGNGRRGELDESSGKRNETVTLVADKPRYWGKLAHMYPNA